MLRRHPHAWTFGLALGGVGLLVALLIPAVQRVRDAAASTSDL